MVKIEQKLKEFRRWRIIGIISGFLGLILILCFSLCFILQNWQYNYIAKLLTQAEQLTELRRELIKIVLTFCFTLVQFLLFSIFYKRFFDSKCIKKRQDELKLNRLTIKSLSKPYSKKKNKVKTKIEVNIKLPKNIEDLTDEDLDTLFEDLRVILKTDSEKDIRLTSIKKGSIILTFELSLENAIILLTNYQKYKLLNIHIQSIDLKWSIPFWKRAMDISISLTLIILLFPIMLIFSILIILENSGSIFVYHKRIGIGLKEFSCLKFRTIKYDPIQNISQITKTGYLLRKTYLDEIPQLFNVLNGNMTFVGRKHIHSDLTDLKFNNINLIKRLIIPIGLTGLWRLQNREMTLDEHFHKDMSYQERFNPILDLKIIFLTLLRMLRVKS